MQPNCSSLPPPRPRRNLTEKHRRQQMKALYRQLASLVPSPVKNLGAFDVLDQATNYIKQLEENVNDLKSRKDCLQVPVEITVNESESGETLEINIVCGSEKKKMKMHKIFQILKEEGAEVVSATNSTMGLKIYHTIVCKAFSPRIGMDTIRVQQRLNNFISDLNI